MTIILQITAAPTGYHIVELGGAYEDSWEDGGVRSTSERAPG